jgi:hypothetical protein
MNSLTEIPKRMWIHTAWSVIYKPGYVIFSTHKCSSAGPVKNTGIINSRAENPRRVWIHTACKIHQPGYVNFSNKRRYPLYIRQKWIHTVWIFHRIFHTVTHHKCWTGYNAIRSKITEIHMMEYSFWQIIYDPEGCEFTRHMNNSSTRICEFFDLRVNMCTNTTIKPESSTTGSCIHIQKSKFTLCMNFKTRRPGF